MGEVRVELGFTTVVFYQILLKISGDLALPPKLQIGELVVFVTTLFATSYFAGFPIVLFSIIALSADQLLRFSGSFLCGRY